jgi:hypothetical protein
MQAEDKISHKVIVKTDLKLSFATDLVLTLASLTVCVRRHSTAKLAIMYYSIDTESFDDYFKQHKVPFQEAGCQSIKR